MDNELYKKSVEEFDKELNEEYEKENNDYLNNNLPAPLEIQMQEFYVGYMDLLGIKDIMNSMLKSEFQDWCNSFAQLIEGVKEENAEYKIEFLMLSDNMVFLSRSLDLIIERMGLLQRKIACNCKTPSLVKGCITRGDIYKYKNRFILGKPLIYAEDMDRNNHSPAIVIDPLIIGELKKGQTIETEVKIDKKYEKMHVVDFYNYAYGLSGEDFCYEEMPQIKELIKKGLIKYKEKKDILCKYEWMKKYHNDFCDFYKLDKEQKIE